MTEQTATGPALACPKCSAAVSPDQAFCENCGESLAPTVAVASDPTEDLDAPVELTVSVRRPPPAEDEATIPVTRPCQNCGGIQFHDRTVIAQRLDGQARGMRG